MDEPDDCAAPTGRPDLLALARHLLMASTVRAALEVTGAALAGLNADEAMIMLRQRGSTQNLRFAGAARAAPAELDSALYQLALHALIHTHGSPSRVGYGDRHPDCHGTVLQRAGGSTLLVTLPSAACEGVLLLNWQSRQPAACLEQTRQLLLQIAQLAGACLAGLNSKQGREDRLSARVATLREAGRHHAAEMRRSVAQTAEARDQASQDSMTGLLNRRGFFAQAEHGFMQARQQALACTVVFADVDGLKVVNDELGHERGDELIRHGAAVFQSAFQDADVVARLGGDEFAAFAFGDAAPEAIRARLHARVTAFNRAGRFPQAVSLSVGVVSCDTFSSASLADYLQMADAEMYRQKHRHVRCAR
ncbi:GGDEF domain-containing protein [Pseudoduganella violacea]|uniref:diguanylate cyclase n=1 Tax=Pseudoduganella violacea TaxID=1715466 RepID=A0A7W5FSL9_9BURK|nr:GGDEF domain-containing protein [Pseudoduganella violacea]MBB3117919.1 diguanylate cyclase (GGDEF)-like protein [Pseudoduganella violacea]